MCMLCNFMAEENWLSMLQVGKSWSRCICVLGCLGNQCVLQVQNLRGHFEHMVDRVESEICGDLIIARATGSQ